ncbi:unnamed protein product [Symbiodinium pilosum]|uniref:Uncharacterized protein n=1 Tax=Symbiodinium pilosum TaxID=2952 RepID=A0A812XAU6_SYMPI|nr:unnamed protein product [Symbiodinium pilosum]
MLSGQRSDDLGNPLNGQNDLELIPGALGRSGKEWCPDDKCDPGFSLVQFRRKFFTEDASDIVLPVKASKIGIIFSFAKSDPFETYLEQHFPTSTGYIDIAWNLVCDPGFFFDITVTDCKPCERGFFRPANTSVFTCLRAPPGTFQRLGLTRCFCLGNTVQWLQCSRLPKTGRLVLMNGELQVMFNALRHALFRCSFRQSRAAAVLWACL